MMDKTEPNGLIEEYLSQITPVLIEEWLSQITAWLSQRTEADFLFILTLLLILFVSYSLLSVISKNQRRIECIERVLGLDSLDLPPNVGAESSSETTSQGQPDGPVRE